MATQKKSSPSYHPLYHVWAGMIQRCTNPNVACWEHYGGKGIRVCPRWRGSFEKFVADMGPRPPQHTLGRIDSNKGYLPSNCRWESWKQQAFSRSNTITVMMASGPVPLSVAAAMLGKNPVTVTQRASKMPVSKALIAALRVKTKLAAKYGEPELNSRTIKTIARAAGVANVPGVYRRMSKDGMSLADSITAALASPSRRKRKVAA